MNSTELDIATAKFVLGLLRREDITEVAGNALEEGYDSPALRELAGLIADEADKAQVVFRRALYEVGATMPTEKNAALLLSTETARGILGGTISAYDGAKHIWSLWLLVHNEDLSALDPFVYAASEWEDRPNDRRLFEDGIVEAARNLVGD